MSDMPDYVRAVYTSVKNTWQDAENLDATHGYVTYIWIPEETFKVDVMKLHVYAEKFRAFSKATSTKQFDVITSGGGGAVVKSSSYTTASHTHSVTGVTTGASSENTTVSGGNHRHRMFDYVTDEIGAGPNRVYACLNPSLGAVAIALRTGEAADLLTEQASGTHTHGMAHTHGVSGQTAQSGGASHRHTVTLTDHTHTVTIPDHTHAITFGIYEEAIGTRTLSAILYDPDGTELKDFGVVLTGEDSDILDLTDYFETLKYGMYKIVLSASGRLRARLVFYELCKMYAQF